MIAFALLTCQSRCYTHNVQWVSALWLEVYVSSNNGINLDNMCNMCLLSELNLLRYNFQSPSPWHVCASGSSPCPCKEDKALPAGLATTASSTALATAKESASASAAAKAVSQASEEASYVWQASILVKEYTRKQESLECVWSQSNLSQEGQSCMLCCCLHVTNWA